MKEEMRVIRIPLPLAIIRQMDDLILEGRAGLGSRADFVREAIEAMVLELKYGVAEPDDRGYQGRDESATTKADDGEAADASSVEAGDNADTALPEPTRPAVFADEVWSGRDEPLFGLHNRDYPSLWAAGRICDLTREGPVSQDVLVRHLTRDAWERGEQLSRLDAHLPGKPSALFPTNRDKPQSSENAFLSFAVGSLLREERRSELRATGPLFAWRVCGATKPDTQELGIGITENGHRLLRNLAGITVRQPHDRSYARTFFEHLQSNAGGDWDGFVQVLRCIGDGADRRDLVPAFWERWPNWTETEAATNAAGYVARGREWGLIEPKQVHGRYLLTGFGQEILEKELNK